MKKLIAVLLAGTIGIAGSLLTQADEHPVISTIPQPSLIPSTARTGGPKKADPRTRVEHLRKAADHLEAAGQVELAREIRGEADDLNAKALARLQELEQQLATIQKEMHTLRAVTGKPSQVLLQCRILELSPETLKSLGKELVEKNAVQANGWRMESGHPGVSIISANDFNQRLNTLISVGDAKAIAEPTIVAADTRSAELVSGGEFPIVIPSEGTKKAVEWRQFGTRIRFVPRLLGGGRVRLEMSPEVTRRDFSRTVMIDGVSVPGLVSRKMDTQVELELGNTIIAALSQANTDDAENVVLIAVTPQMVKPLKVDESH